MAFAIGLSPFTQRSYVSAGGGYLSSTQKAAPLFSRIGTQVGASATGMGYKATPIAQVAPLASTTALVRPVAVNTIPSNRSEGFTPPIPAPVTNVKSTVPGMISQIGLNAMTSAEARAAKAREAAAMRAAADTTQITPPAMVPGQTASDMQSMNQNQMPAVAQLPTYNQPQPSFQQQYQAGPMPGYPSVPSSPYATYETPSGTEGTVPITAASSPLDDLSMQVASTLKSLRDKVASGGTLSDSEKEFVSFMAQAVAQ